MSKQYIETIIDSIDEPIVCLDHDLTLFFINNEALDILNLRSGDAVGRSAQEIAMRNDLLRKLLNGLDERKASENNDKKSEPLKIYADNKESYFQVKYLPVRMSASDGTVTERGTVVMLKNITEFHKLDVAKTTFISTISHELKTPISAILMSLQLLTDNRVGGLNPEQKELSDSIRENGERLLSITGELLNMTQVESGVLQLKPHITDSEKIAWVLTNLLSNAIRYSNENGRVVIGVQQKDAHRIELYVQDFGRGIDPRYHESIFERYFRVPGTKIQGSGLGLSISRDFVEAHSGTLTVDSELGKGSRFVVALPV